LPFQTLPDFPDSSARRSRRKLLSSAILRAKVCYIDKMSEAAGFSRRLLRHRLESVANHRAV
jgi:hypothetical protein